MNIKTLIQDESGSGLTIMFPFFIFIGFMMYALMVNVMVMNSKKNELQIMADASSRAGALGVSTAYAVKERNGHGLDNYHVYVELEQNEANSLADSVLDSFEKMITRTEITNVEKNPVESFLFPVWNSNTFKYDQHSLSSAKQYKNGNFSVLINAEIKTVWPKLLKMPEKVSVEVYSQSTSRGKVTGYK